MHLHLLLAQVHDPDFRDACCGVPGQFHRAVVRQGAAGYLNEQEHIFRARAMVGCSDKHLIRQESESTEQKRVGGTLTAYGGGRAMTGIYGRVVGERQEGLKDRFHELR